MTDFDLLYLRANLEVTWAQESYMVQEGGEEIS